MNQRWNTLLKGLAAIAAVIVICVSVSRILGIGSQTLGDIAREYPQPTAAPEESGEFSQNMSAAGELSDTSPTLATPGTSQDNSPALSAAGEHASGSSLSGGGSGSGPTDVPDAGDDAYNTENPLEDAPMAASADAAPGGGFEKGSNGELMADARITWEDGFYYEPLSESLAEYITGISYPENEKEPAVTISELSYVHVLYCDFEGNPAQGELICNQSIAQDLVEIFYELYRAEYRIEKIRLIDEYEGDDDLSMADNNTSCFNYRVVSGSSSLSRHAYGLAIDINPLYNPYITYNRDHSINVAPAAGEEYADRSKTFPYKIDENDLCCRLFKEHGFTWGGDWNSCKDYQHFQKTP